MRKVILSNGAIATVDDCDYERINRFKWHPHPIGYAQHTYYDENGKSKCILMHRLVMSAPKGVEIDHRDGNRLRNVRSNLRQASRSQNCANKRLPSNNKTGLKGVSRRPSGRWAAHISKDGKRYFLGSFSTKCQAATAYDKAAIELFGEFARTNRALGLLPITTEAAFFSVYFY